MTERSLSLRLATPRDADDWNEFLAAMPEASPLARFEWGSILEEAYGAETRFLVAEAAGTIVGVLPCFIARSLRGRRRLYSLRFGLVAQSDDVAGALLDEIDRLKRDESFTGTMVSSGWRGFPSRSANVIRKTVALRLRGETSELWEGLRDKTRNMIRRAKRAGVTVASGYEYIDVLYEQYRDNMLRLGVPLHSRRYFHAIARHLGADTEILVALHDGEPIASMMVHYGNGIGCYPVQNALFAHRDLAPIQLLNWTAMQRCLARGLGTLDMGEATEGGNVFRSKLNFGGEAMDINYFASGVSLADQGISRSSLHQQPQSQGRRLESWTAHSSPIAIRRLWLETKLRHGRLL